MKHERIMVVGLALISAVGLGVANFAGCGGTIENNDNLTKSEARELGKADWWDDYCELYGWYGDGICDDFCPLPDPDCNSGGRSDHQPVCKTDDARGAGWYWHDTDQLIKLEDCAGMAEAECAAIGSRSEGWFTDSGIIVLDNCHQAVGIALWGEVCGGSIGEICNDDLYCQGMPADLLGGSGICRQVGYCEQDSDCEVEGNSWTHPACMGYAACEAHACAWHCEQQPAGTWSWTTTLLGGVESDHPYPDNSERQWVINRDGAAKIKIHFARIELEQGYDWISISGEGEESAFVIDTSRDDLWTPGFEGDSLTITLHSDESVSYFGFEADAVSYYEQLDPGLCNTDDDCAAGLSCFPHQCFNAYAPCYGDCREGSQASGGTFVAEDTPLQIPDADPQGIRSTIKVQGLGECQPQITLDFSIAHTYAGDLVVGLTDPQGERLVLSNRQGGDADGLTADGFSLTGQLGSGGADGVWSLDVSDNAALDTGSLDSWSLTFVCD